MNKRKPLITLKKTTQRTNKYFDYIIEEAQRNAYCMKRITCKDNRRLKKENTYYID